MNKVVLGRFQVVCYQNNVLVKRIVRSLFHINRQHHHGYTGYILEQDVVPVLHQFHIYENSIAFLSTDDNQYYYFASNRKE